MKKLLIATAISSVLSLSSAQAFYITPSFSHVSSSVKGGNDVGTSVWGLEAGGKYGSVSYSNTSYNVDKSKNIDNLHNLTIRGEYFDVIGDGLSYYVGCSYTAAWQDDFHASKNYNITPFATLTYATDDELSFTFGGGASFSKPKNSLFPILQANFKNESQEGLSFSLGFPVNKLTYRFNEYVAASTEFDFNYSPYYLLSDDSAYVPKGYIQDRSNEIQGYLTINPTQNFAIKAGAAYTINRKLKFYFDDGDELASFKLDNSLKFFLNGTASF